MMCLVEYWQLIRPLVEHFIAPAQHSQPFSNLKTKKFRDQQLIPILAGAEKGRPKRR
jgi:hypothetical protein